MVDEIPPMPPHGRFEQVSERVRNYNAAPMSVAVCPVRTIMDMVGSKWSALLIMALAERPHRFGEIKRAVSDILQRMLAQSLRELQRDGLISRTVHPTAPPTVEYALTPLGMSLLQPLTQLIGWAHANEETIAEARSEYDTAR